MENLIFSLNATVPIFLLMLLGLFFRKIGWIDDDFASKMNKFVFLVPLPVLVFEDLATVDFSKVWDVRFVLFCFAATLISIGVGIAKPVSFVLEFLSHLYKEMAEEKDGYLITSNGYKHYKLLVHHLVPMDTAYYLKEEDQIPALGIEQMIKTNERKMIHVRIDDIPKGCWQIRRYCLNQESGSILNEWSNLDMDTELRMEELNYLEKVCPRMFIRKQNIDRNVLEFDIELEPNEVQYLHITEFN